jgi:hypothetical protein
MQLDVNDIRSLLPQHKSDVDRACTVVERGYPAVASILPELLEWIQDYNWPVAKVLAAFLVTIGVPLVPELRRALHTTDEVWKYWILKEIVANSPEVAEELADELARLATSPTLHEMEEDLNLVAQEILQTLNSSSGSS